MFTGIIGQLASVREVRDEPPGVRLFIHCPELAHEAVIGDSIAINGCCLTVVTNADECLGFDAGPETLKRTTLGDLVAGSPVNVEASLRIGDRLGGHFVTGHIDAVGAVVAREDEKDWSTFWFSFPPDLDRYIASKGSIAVDGISLTLVEVQRDRFSVALIPHTLGVTTLGRLGVGDPVNLETDLLAKYAQKQPVDAL